MKRICRAMLGAAGVLLAATAMAQDNYPSRPVRLLVSDTPGSAPDVLARKAEKAKPPAERGPQTY